MRRHSSEVSEPLSQEQSARARFDLAPTAEQRVQALARDPHAAPRLAVKDQNFPASAFAFAPKSVASAFAQRFKVVVLSSP
jgi:hypothetical protein